MAVSLPLNNFRTAMRVASCAFEAPVFHDALPRQKKHSFAPMSSPYLPRLPHLQRDVPMFPSYATSNGSPHGSSTNSPSLEPTRAPKKNPSRERMKTELHALRTQASCLETELAYLQQLAQERLAADNGALDDSEPIRNSREPTGGWMAVAERQRARRIRAEMENRRLRATVESQLDEWKTLQILFTTKSQTLLDKITNVHGSIESSGSTLTMRVPAPSPRER